MEAIGGRASGVRPSPRRWEDVGPRRVFRAVLCLVTLDRLLAIDREILKKLLAGARPLHTATKREIATVKLKRLFPRPQRVILAAGEGINLRQPLQHARASRPKSELLLEHLRCLLVALLGHVHCNQRAGAGYRAR